MPVASKAAPGARVRQATPEETRELARALERRLEALHETLRAQNADFDRASLELAGAARWFASVPPESSEWERLQAELQRILDKYPKASLILEMTIAARRLQVYRETGELPADVPDREQIRLLLENPWDRIVRDPREEPTTTFELEKDILALARQIERFNRLPETQAARKPAEPPLRTPAPLPEKPVARGARQLELEQDGGTGREAVDPVPGLIALLASPEPRKRALAADELGRRGAASPEAAAALRKALGDDAARVRASAALALGGFGERGRRLAEELRFLMTDPSAEVRFSARTALDRLNLR